MRSNPATPATPVRVTPVPTFRALFASLKRWPPGAAALDVAGDAAPGRKGTGSGAGTGGAGAKADRAAGHQPGQAADLGMVARGDGGVNEPVFVTIHKPLPARPGPPAFHTNRPLIWLCGFPMGRFSA